MIELSGVGKTYQSLRRGRSVRALDGVDMAVRAGEVFGIAGPNGAGKSTLIALLLGYLLPDRGSITIDGLLPRLYVERNGIGYLSELVTIKPSWRVDGALRRFATLAGVEERAIWPRVTSVIEMLGLGDHARKTVKALSKGNLQRLGLGQALLHEERLLVLDEPTHGLDPVWTQRFRDIVAALRRPDRAIVIASHNLDELQRVADRVAIFDGGRLQRIVDTRADGGAVMAGAFRIAVVTGADQVGVAFPGAVPLGGGEFEVNVVDLGALNAGLARLIAAGTMVASIAPAHSALEQQFREAVGSGAGTGSR
ncbi:MAG: hypothetical protein NVS1B4_21190 [Gemmatimonadaceae bacterium]